VTRAEALAEAQRRWGLRAKLWNRTDPRYKGRFRVGRELREYCGEVMGSGPSWEAAFADADRRAQ